MWQPKPCPGGLHAGHQRPPFPGTSLRGGPPALALWPQLFASGRKTRRRRGVKTLNRSNEIPICAVVGPVAVLSSPTSSGPCLQTRPWRWRAGSLAGHVVLLLGLPVLTVRALGEALLRGLCLSCGHGGRRGFLQRDPRDPSSPARALPSLSLVTHAGPPGATPRWPWARRA